MPPRLLEFSPKFTGALLPSRGTSSSLGRSLSHHSNTSRRKFRARAASPKDADRLATTLTSLDVLLGGESQPSAPSLPIGPETPPAASIGFQAEADIAAADDGNATSATTRALRVRSLQEYVKAALELGMGSVRDHFKPVRIVDQDDADLPRAKPRFSYLFLSANILVYAVGLSFRLTEGQDGPTDFFLSLANVNDAVETGEYYRLVTANFLHDSFVHLCASSYALLTFAPEAEAVLGGLTFASTYLLSGVAGTAFCFLLTDTLTVGASSGIFGLIGALGAFLYKNHKVPHSSEQLLFAAGAVLFNLVLGGKSESAIDNLGHLGGLLCGIYLGTLLTPAIIKPETESDESEMPPQPDSARPELDATVKVVQPNPGQSAIVLLCVSLTLASGVAAAVLHRTGVLPALKLPYWLG